ncbi:MAG: hypothetical protein U9O87_04740, partial [Verrucomicrobiota bacterium]|nr:hypothetical protein [Verrucomicrobiota bacterium]
MFYKMNKNKGIALIIVLGVISVVMVMVLSMTSTSKISAVSSKIAKEHGNLKYSAESVAAHTIWMYICDRRRYPSSHKNLLSNIDMNRIDQEEEVWLADGDSHTFTMDSFGSLFL